MSYYNSFLCTEKMNVLLNEMMQKQPFQQDYIQNDISRENND